MREIWIHIEGGGNSSQKEQLRQGFGAFLGELQDRARARGVRIRATFWGPRSETNAAFARSRRQNPETLHLLLVDSEGPVTVPPRQHLTDMDGWNLADVSENACHMMVELMESWFLADPDCLARYFGHGFAASALPATRIVEQIPKAAVLSSLDRASRNTKKQKYDKARDSHRILATLDIRKVRERAPHCERLFAEIEQALAGTTS